MPLMQDHVSMMQVAAQGMTTIMNSVLQLGAMEEGLFQVALNVASMAAMLRNVVHQLTPWAKMDNISFVAEIDPSIPPALLFDTQRLSQVVNNICTNAFKFVSHDGSGHVALRAKLLKTRSGEHDDAIPISLAPSKASIGKPMSPILLHPTTLAIVRVEVEDNGCGIAESEIPKLFVPYFQIRSGGSTDPKLVSGTGLGLSIAKQVRYFLYHKVRLRQ